MTHTDPGGIPVERFHSMSIPASSIHTEANQHARQPPAVTKGEDFNLRNSTIS